MCKYLKFVLFTIFSVYTLNIKCSVSLVKHLINDLKYLNKKSLVFNLSICLRNLDFIPQGQPMKPTMYLYFL